MKLWKKLLIAACALVLILAMGVWALFPEERIRQEIAQQSQSRLGCALKVDGIRPMWVGVQLTGLKAADCPELSVKSLDVASLAVKLQLLPLLRQEVIVTSLTIDRPQIDLTTTEASEDNVQAAQESADKESGNGDTQGEATTANSNYQVHIESFRIRDARIRYGGADKSTTQVALSGLNYQTSAQYTGESVRIAGDLRIAAISARSPMGSLGKGLSLHLKNDLSYHFEKDELELKKVQLELGGIQSQLTGKIKDLSQDNRHLDLKLKGSTEKLAAAVAFLPREILPEGMPNKSGGAVELSARYLGSIPQDLSNWHQAEQTFQANFKLSDGFFKYKNGPAAQAIQVELAANKNTFDVRRFSAQYQNSSMSLSSQVNNYLAESPQLSGTFSMNAHLTDVQKYLDEIKQLAGDLKGKLNFSGSVEKPRLSGTFNLAGVQAISEKGEWPALEKLDADLTFSNDQIAIESSDIKVGTSDFKLSGSAGNWMALADLENAKKPFELKFKSQSEQLILSELMPTESEEADNPEAETDLAFLDNVKIDGEMQAGLLKTESLDLKNVRLKFSLLDRIFQLESLETKALGGALAFSGKLDLHEGARRSLQGKMDISKLDFAQTLQSFYFLNAYGGLAKALDGRFSSQLNFSSQLDEDFIPQLSSLEAQGLLNILNGQLSGHPVQSGLAKTLNYEGIRSLDVENWAQKFKIAKGRLSLDDLNIEAQGFKMNIGGTQSLDGGLDMNLDLSIPKSLEDKINLPQFAQPLWALGRGDFIQLPLKLGGQLNQPKLSIDKGQIEQRLSARVKAKAKNQVKDQLKELKKEKDLPKALKRGKPKKEELKKDLKKGIKKLF